MNFDLSQDQKMLADSAASFARKSSPVTRLRRLRDHAVGYERSVWKQMAELGWLGLPFSEEDGGLGGTPVELILLLEQLGTTLVPEPIVPSVILAGTVLARAGSKEQKTRYLSPLIEGNAVIALAWAERAGRYDFRAPKTQAKNGKLTGEKVFVLAGHDADQLLVTAADGVYLVARGAPGLTVTPIATMDGHHAALVVLDHTPGEKLSASLDAVGEALDLAALGACAEGLGIVSTVLAMTTDYLRTREQFGVKIGTFQALQHRAVDMFVEVELCRSLTTIAAIKVDAESISAAKVQLATGGRFVTQQGIQLHGGIGVTDEHDIGLYFKRLQVLSALYGDEEHHVARFAAQPGFASV